MDRRTVIAAAVGVGVLCFAGGAATMRTAETHGWFGLHPASSNSTAVADQGFAWPFFGKPRAADAPRAAPPKPAGFAVWQSRTDTSKPDAAACIQMTRPLDPSKAYADFVLVSPDLGHPAAVTVKNDVLCVGGLGLIDHRVTLLKGLPARGGETLSANADVDFTFGEKPPYVGFAGQGVILPREESDGVGIETINVQKAGHRGLARAGQETWCASRSAPPTPRPRATIPATTATTAPTTRARSSGRARSPSRAPPARRPPPSSLWARC